MILFKNGTGITESRRKENQYLHTYIQTKRTETAIQLQRKSAASGSYNDTLMKSIFPF